MKRISLLAALMLVLTIGANAQGDFISVKDLATKLNNPKYMIVDARKDADYKKVHITNAISMPVEDLSVKTPVEGVLKSDAEILQILGDNGVDLSKNIVLYCSKGNSAGRLYWILKMAGAENVQLLDGNLDAWKAGRKPVTKNPKLTKKVKLSATLNKGSYISMADVKTKIGKANVVLVDAREDAYFNGTDPKSKGHIPGAINISSDLMKDDKGLLLPDADLGKLFSSKGVTKDKEVILYCQTSTRAGLLYTVLTSKLGYSNVKVFDGAYNEWASDAANKIEK